MVILQESKVPKSQGKPEQIRRRREEDLGPMVT